ncbi:MAG: alkaline phosphatase family protein [Chloroflexi bacterium]|nr:alkaline phosphatase family protein [Chloroflexota bacterium]MCC6896952.1 alkaline phosphatase family protein [Anaerolineae bacterium]
MINQNSLNSIAAHRQDAHFIKPAYDSYCFAALPQLVRHLLTGKGELGFPPDVLSGLPANYDKVVLLYIDAFGWRFFERYGDRYPFLKRFVEQGVASKMTSQFPSTTAAHLTTIHLGQPVGKYGIYEWFYYEPLLERMISPLIFSYAGDTEPGTIQLPPGINIGSAFGFQTLYEQLAQHGVNSYVFQNVAYTNGGFADLALRGAEIRGFRTMSEGLLNLAEAVVAEQGKAYFYYYYDPIDSAGHKYGPSTPYFDAEVDAWFSAAEKLLHNTLSGKAGKTLLLLTADHGQDDIDPTKTIHINKIAPEIVPLVRTDSEGRLLVPAGSARDMFIYIKEGHVDEAYNLLVNHPALAGKAEVRRVSDLIAQGYFGASPSPMFMERIADLVVLPYNGLMVWWYDESRHEFPFRGHHGGLTPYEMEIPLLALAY